MINIPLPEPAWSKEQPEAEENDKEQTDGADVSIAESLQTKEVPSLEPPASIFKPIEYPPLHIFVSIEKCSWIDS